MKEPAKPTDRYKLESGSQGTATFIYEKNSDLVVELYDYSPDAQSHFGNDVAFLMIISAADASLIKSQIALEMTEPGPDPGSDVKFLMSKRFSNYHQIKKWLVEKGIPFREEFDSWA